MTLIEQARKQEATSTAQAAQSYRELLARVDKPRSGDAELLAVVLNVLDLTIDDFQADVAAIEKVQRLETSCPTESAIATAKKAETAGKEQARQSLLKSIAEMIANAPLFDVFKFHEQTRIFVAMRLGGAENLAGLKWSRNSTAA